MNNRIPKARSGDLVKSEDGVNGRILSYLCRRHSIRECFKPGFFNIIASNVSPGDQIRCIQITNTRRDVDAIVSASWTGIVLKVDTTSRQEEVIFVPIDSQGIQIYKLPTKEELEVQKPTPDTNYIQGDGRVEHNKVPNTFTVMEGAKEICTVDTKAEASAIARGDKEIPKEVAIF